MRHIQVATKDNGLLRIKLLEVGAEGILPIHAVVDAGQLLLRVRRVNGDKIKRIEFQRDHAAFCVVLRDAEPKLHGARFLLGEDRRAGIPLALRIVPILMVICKRRLIQLNLPCLDFCFL